MFKFKQAAKNVSRDVTELKNEHDDEHATGPSVFTNSNSVLNFNRKRTSTGSFEKTSHEGLTHHHSGSQVSSGEGSDLEGGQATNKRGGLANQKTENCWTRVRDMIGMSDVFISRGENPPFVACLQVSVWFIPLLLVFCLWDTLAVTAFQIPQLSTVHLPGFLLGWHFVMMMLAMYGFMLSYLSSGDSPRTKLAMISLGVHYLLLAYRVFLEIYFDGYRGQWKLYYEKTKKVF